MLQNLVHDLRYAVRTLRKSPGFAVTAILTLALGIGANTAIFSILDPLLLRKLPVSRPEELVRVDAAGSLGNAGAWQARDFAWCRRRHSDHASTFSAAVRLPHTRPTINRRTSGTVSGINGGDFRGPLFVDAPAPRPGIG